MSDQSTEPSGVAPTPTTIRETRSPDGDGLGTTEPNTALDSANGELPIAQGAAKSSGVTTAAKAERNSPKVGAGSEPAASLSSQLGMAPTPRQDLTDVFAWLEDWCPPEYVKRLRTALSSFRSAPTVADEQHDQLTHIEARLGTDQELPTDRENAAHLRKRLGMSIDIEMELRRELWLNHGHQMLYGDDGEMQCGACHPTWDYRRAPIQDVLDAASKARLQRLVASLRPEPSTEPPTRSDEHFSLRERIDSLARALYTAGIRATPDNNDGLPRLVAEGVLMNLVKVQRVGLYRIKSELPEALRDSSSQSEPPDEERIPHRFNSRTPYEPGDDRDIWCKHCEYHRDHSIHALGIEAPPTAKEPSK